MHRLRKRLQELGIKTFSEYIPLLRNDNKEEIKIFINAITTNETFFFRHTKQFNYFYEKLLPKITVREDKNLRVWSAACSSGEEPYSIAIACREFFKRKPEWKYAIYASDVNSEVLNEAKEGYYSEKSLAKIPLILKKRYFSLNNEETDRKRKYILKPDIKKSVVFLKKVSVR